MPALVIRRRFAQRGLRLMRELEYVSRSIVHQADHAYVLVQVCNLRSAREQCFVLVPELHDFGLRGSIKATEQMHLRFIHRFICKH